MNRLWSAHCSVATPPHRQHVPAYLNTHILRYPPASFTDEQLAECSKWAHRPLLPWLVRNEQKFSSYDFSKGYTGTAFRLKAGGGIWTLCGLSSGQWNEQLNSYVQAIQAAKNIPPAQRLKYVYNAGDDFSFRALGVLNRGSGRGTNVDVMIDLSTFYIGGPSPNPTHYCRCPRFQVVSEASQKDMLCLEDFHPYLNMQYGAGFMKPDRPLPA